MGDVPVISFDNLDALDAATPDTGLVPAPDSSPGFSVQNLANLVTFKQQDIAPPSAFYVTVDDLFYIQVYNSNPSVTSVQVQMRVLTPDGEIKAAIYTVPCTSNRAASALQAQLDEGFILSAFAQAYPVAPKRGQTFCAAQIFRGRVGGGGPVTEQLFGDYVGTLQSAAYPVGRAINPAEGPGVFRSITGTQPAVGSQISETVPTGARWRIVSFRATLTTSNVAFGRTVAFSLTDGANTWYQAPATNTQQALTTDSYSLAGGVSVIAGPGVVNTIPAPVGQCALGGWQISSVGTVFQPTDQWSAPQYVVEEWIDA